MLLQNAKAVLEDLKSMEDDVATADEALEFDHSVIGGLDRLSQMTKAEISGKTLAASYHKPC
jgi:hypothetical protein